jgi:hypothetical protein
MGTAHPSIVAGRDLMTELHGQVQLAAMQAEEPVLFYAGFFGALVGQMSALIGRGEAVAVFDCVRPLVDAIAAADGPLQ